MNRRMAVNGREENRAEARMLSDGACERLYWGALEILERVGVRFFDQEALALMKSAGMVVQDGNRVHVPAGLVERALTTVPKKIDFYDRHGRKAMTLGGRNTYFGTGSDCLSILDHRTDTHRRAVLQDIYEGMVVSDALDEIDFVMCMFLPSDVDQDRVDLYEMEAMLTTTTKPVVFVSPEFKGAMDCVRMAELVAGGSDELRCKPRVACYVNVTTGLRHNDEALQKLLYFSEKGVPFVYKPSAQGGTTAPITVAACAAIEQAGALAGLVLSQLKREGAPFILPGWSGQQLDMRAMVQPYADPEKHGHAADFAHYLNLPMFNLTGVSDSKCVDQQASAEASLTILADALFGGNLCHDVGYLDSGLLGSLSQLVICDEIIGWTRNLVRGYEFTEETLCIDLIEEKGPDGQYLDSPHTLNNFRQRWYPKLFERRGYSEWVKNGSKTLAQRAAEKVDKILENHRPEPLPPDLAGRLKAIVEGTDR